jgi:hypothetical protein
MEDRQIRTIARLREQIRREVQAIYDLRLAAEGLAAFPVLYLFVAHLLRREWPVDLIGYSLITYLLIVFVIRPVAASHMRARSTALQEELASFPPEQIEELLLPLRSDPSAETRAFVAPLLRKFGLHGVHRTPGASPRSIAGAPAPGPPAGPGDADPSSPHPPAD